MQDINLIDTLLPTFGFEAGGVQVHLDILNEDCWIEVSVDHAELALKTALSLIESAGLELMEEDEMITADGKVRTYLMEVVE